jgi:hypothetical protein
MADPILEELWRVREQLLKQHGGWEGYFQYIEKLDRARRRRPRTQRPVKVHKQTPKTSH